MARITSTGDRRVTSTGDVRVTAVAGETVIPASTLVVFAQSVVEVIPASTLVTFSQHVRKNPVTLAASTLVTFDQSVIESTVIAASTLVTFHQRTEEVIPAGRLVEFRQLVLTAQDVAQNQMFVSLSGQDITQNVAHAISITGTEGDNRTASLRLRKLPAGPIDIPGYAGQAITITRLIDGALTPLFTGKVKTPVWDRDNRQLVLECSDFRNRRIAREDQARLTAMTGGLYSPITQREDAVGEQWTRELMKTVAGTLDYTGAGVLRYSSWAVGTPGHTLTDADVHYRDIRLEFANVDEIVNAVPATLEYRYFRRNAISHAVALNVQEAGYCKLAGCLPAAQVTIDGVTTPQILPTKESLLSAAESVSSWHLTDFTFRELPPDGYYRNTSNVTSKILYQAGGITRETFAMGADLTLERYISQPQREVYELRVEAPESIDQYGETEGSSMRYSTETRVDGSVYEERGCTVVADPDDRRADVDLAIQCIQRMAKKTILASHRKNYMQVLHKADLLPVEIGQTVSVNTAEFTGLGTVTEFSHTTTDDGDYYTSFKLAISRVESNVSVTEDWSLPAEPDSYALNSDSQALPSTPSCPAPAGEAEVSGPSRLEPDGTVIITAPQVDRSQVDEIIGTRAHTYNVKIPVNTFTVEVPA